MIFAGSILEVIAYDRALSDGVRQKLEGYLAHKWDTPTSKLIVLELVSRTQLQEHQASLWWYSDPHLPASIGQAGGCICHPLTVTADSGLTTFSFDSNDSTVASFGGNATDGYTVTGLKEGKVTITATQPGQAPWNSATATQPFIVTSAPRQDQNITFADIPDKNVQSSSFDLDANASSGLPVSFESLHPLIATVETNGTVTIVGPGVATIPCNSSG